jgi:hypothetical protein
MAGPEYGRVVRSVAWTTIDSAKCVHELHKECREKAKQRNRSDYRAIVNLKEQVEAVFRSRFISRIRSMSRILFVRQVTQKLAQVASGRVKTKLRC